MPLSSRRLASCRRAGAARARGYEKVILVGWSGGGSLSLFYQAEAEAPSITATPAGDAVDLTQAGLEPADGVIFIAANLSRAETLIARWLLETMKPVSVE
jgi:hypothetical protein